MKGMLKLVFPLSNLYLKTHSEPCRHEFDRAPLLYKYPDVNPKTAKNICIQLMKNEKFYVKVCHLMNLLCLNPPFENDYLTNKTYLQSHNKEKVNIHFIKHCDNLGIRIVLQKLDVVGK